MSRHDTAALIAAWREAAGSGLPLVLATVTHTSGSTYRKAGARMLIGAEGVLAGVVGGGCFDRDLVERAVAMRARKQAEVVTYDLRSPEEAIWGLGLGCEGMVELFLQPLDHRRAEGHPMHCLAQALAGGGGWVATRLDGADAGYTWLLDGAPGPAADAVFVDHVRTPLHLVICGAGVDAVPVAAMAAHLGWQISVIDHRPPYLSPERFPAARLLPLTEGLPDAVVDADAIIIMSHSLAMDRRYLQLWSEQPAGYIGVLGPPARRWRLLDDLGSAGDALRHRLRGPVGLALGGELPEEVALSMLAEIQAWRYRRDARPLTRPAEADSERARQVAEVPFDS